MIMAAVVLTTQATMAQGLRAQGRRMINTDGVEVEVIKAMRPDTVTPNGEWQKVVEMQMPAKEGFKYMRQALAKLVPDYQHNVQLEDTADCKIVAKVALPLRAQSKNGYWNQGQYNLTLTVMMKDNRYRVSGEDVKCETGLDIRVPGVDTSEGLEFSSYNKDSDGSFQRDLQWKAGQLMAKIDSMLKKQKTDNDF